MTNEIMKSSELACYRQCLFDYNSSHNNFPAIESLNPIDIGTEKQFRFTAKMLAEMFNVAKNTIKNRIELLESTGDLSEQNFDHSNVPDSRGVPNDTIIYDLTVLNKLAMTMIDNPIAVNVRKAFNDVIVKVETTGRYNINQPISSYQIEDPIERAKAWIAEQEAKLALEAKNNELTERLTIASDERDEAIKHRHHINSKRVATLMQNDGVKTRKINDLTTECINLTEQLNEQTSQIIDTLDKLDTANHQKALVESKLEAILSSMYSVDDVYHHVENLFHTGYQPSTLRSKLRKELNRISYTFGEVPRVGVNRRNPEHNPPKYYTERVVEQIIENGKNDPMYFKHIKG